ncbi:Ff.00g111280.m01.CDS01 [Fusarium sp. VM40]|nr:Ff.00g111280.m01.CDS01 [Fusarium sp. VM40]
MAPSQAPFLYSAVHSDSRFPEPKFDPKAVTRASWTPPSPRKKHDGPLVSFNTHPDMHEVLTYRANEYASMSPRSKSFIKWLRHLQSALRVLQLVGALGLLALMVLIDKVPTLEGWVMRITPAVAIVHCVYGIYHHSRDAAGRSPASSASYQLFSGVTDLGVAPLYAFGALSVRTKSDIWITRLSNQSLMDTFKPVLFYTFVAAGGLHVISLAIAGWLGFMFRKISLMPPDMNPLESHLTARPKHKKNKSSVMTASTMDSDGRRDSIIPQEGIHDGIEPPRTIPFRHTRNGSTTTVGTRDSRSQFPASPQYQRPPTTPRRDRRDSAASRATTRTSATRSIYHDAYSEIPLDEQDSSRPPSSYRYSQPRPAKFTETWRPTDSLISRTNQRNRELEASKTSTANRENKSYEALGQRYVHEDSDSEYGDENNPSYDMGVDGDELRPHPLRLNPPAEQRERTSPPRAKTPYFPFKDSLTDISSNARRVSASRDIADEKPAFTSQKRQSSIQPESEFYARSYGELKSATPPVMVGSDNRKVSTGNDYNQNAAGAYGRRNVSGKMAEEGRAAGNRFSFLDGRNPLAERR